MQPVGWIFREECKIYKVSKPSKENMVFFAVRPRQMLKRYIALKKINLRGC
jgi:hypothetical protein